MAYLLQDEFPDLDMNKVIKMCLIHDLGECFTGDIPIFEKPMKTPLQKTIFWHSGSAIFPSHIVMIWLHYMLK